MSMTPAEFAQKWKGSGAKERSASQEHFIDLCRMLGYPTPNEADQTGDFYAFEKGIEKSAGGDGFADVWKKADDIDPARSNLLRVECVSSEPVRTRRGPELKNARLSAPVPSLTAPFGRRTPGRAGGS